ncbi:MarR family winged helix-turn-helix transcriptional regulator [Hoeflea olei]|uniref:Transcriptional regulator n=1 Tax=Hoeflea olei TaxID=1480615 RepID=A0A1C1YWD4_9HYPH|nr:MarR family transcriptional regulator [Hoeflea olei]OCW57864.1 transcriptional regulator [Hoeflea olei]
MTDTKPPVPEKSEPYERLGEIGLSNFAPYLMNRIMGRYNANLRQEMSGLGLTTAKMRALAVLSVIDALPITELAVYAVVEQSTLSRSLEQLTNDGLVRRDPDPTDNRVTRIAITDAGRAAFEQLWPTMAQNYSQMFAGITDEERAVFVETLKKMLNNIRKHNF